MKEFRFDLSRELVRIGLNGFTIRKEICVSEIAFTYFLGGDPARELVESSSDDG